MYPNDPCLLKPSCPPRTAGALSVIAQWIGSAIADFVFAFLSCVLVLRESSA
jgi:hypothetical protein